ncbi:cation:proton antiporter [Patescibacteria group bacterium]|nr:cation:proton antiporter [Patescibacteria group bacterium]
MNPAILYITIILSLAVIGGFIASKFNQYITVGYILIGLTIGSIITSITHSQNEIQSLAYIGVALLVFSSGADFSIDKIRSYKNDIIKGSIIQVFIGSILSILIISIFHIALEDAIIIAIALSMSSTIIVTKVLKDLERNYSMEGEITTAWLMLQDILAIPVIIFITNLTIHGGGSIAIPIIIAILKSIIVLIVIYYLGLIFIPYILDKIAKTEIRELMLLASVSILFIIILISHFVGISSIIAAFIAGLIISKGILKHQVTYEIKPLKDIFSVFFFVLIGSLIPIIFLIENIIYIVILAVIISFIKYIVTFTILRTEKYHSLVSSIISSNLYGAGEFSFVIGTIAYSSGLLSLYGYHILLSITILTMITTPYIIKNNIELYHKSKNFLKKLPYIPDHIFSSTPLPNITEDKKADIIIAGYGRVGKTIVDILKQNKIKCYVIDFNKNILESNKNDKIVNFIYGDADSMDILKLANIENAKILIITTPSIEVNYKITQIAKQLNSKVKIIARSHLEKHKDILKESGVEYIIEAEKETALTITELLLQHIGKSRREINMILNK